MVAAGLLLVGLDHGRFWQDEAETALLARNILRFGYPRAFDGEIRINPAIPVGRGQAWTYHPWGHFYFVALSFWLFGESTWAGRLPQAVLGWLSLLLAIRLMWRWTSSLRLTRLFAVWMTVQVPLIIHFRQCRYYAPTVLASLGVAWCYLTWLERRPRASIQLGLAWIALFHIHHGAFTMLALACFLHMLLTQAWRGRSLSLGAWCLVTLAGTLPFLWFYQSGSLAGSWDWHRIAQHAAYYIRKTNHYLFPWTAWGILFVIWPGFRRSILRSLAQYPKAFQDPLAWPVWALCVVMTGMVFLILIPAQRHFRYLLPLIPWWTLIQVALLARAIQIRRPIGIALGLILCLTDLHYAWPQGKPARSLLWELVSTLNHPYRGPVDGVVEALKTYGRPGQTVKTPVEDLPILFYTDLKVEPLLHIDHFSNESYPDWIILRKDWIPPSFYRSNHFRTIRQRYRRMVLDVPDIPWQNLPDPDYHRFRTDRFGPRVVVYVKR
jgi:hypothetical protein